MRLLRTSCSLCWLLDCSGRCVLNSSSPVGSMASKAGARSSAVIFWEQLCMQHSSATSILFSLCAVRLCAVAPLTPENAACVHLRLPGLWAHQLCLGFLSIAQLRQSRFDVQHHTQMFCSQIPHIPPFWLEKEYTFGETVEG